MKYAMFAAVATASMAGAAYTHAPAKLMTQWGEKTTPENAWREYPRPQMVRNGWTNLNGLWQYAITGTPRSFPAKWDGEILVPYPVESALSGVGRLLDPKETLWYRRTFKASPKPGERLFLNFEQADYRAMVFVNGREAGVPHEGGQTPFSFDITDLAKPGENELVVSVWDPTSDFIGATGKQALHPSGCFYTRCSGIGGTVWLETAPADARIAGYKTTTDIDAGTVRLAFDVEGSRFNRPEVEVTIEGRKARTKDGVLVFKMPKGFKLWSPESPALYKFTAKCGKDAVQGYFGMRKIEVKKDANGVLRIFFNNKPRFLLGTLDQGWWPDGLLTPPSEEAMAFDIAALKEMGYDMMRKHIKVEPRRYYYLCDKMGMIVMQDMPSNWCDPDTRRVKNHPHDPVKSYGDYRKGLKEMIDHLYNHPSIVAWVPYNESWGQPEEFLTHSTLVWTQKYDPSRIVDGPSGWNDYEGGRNHRNRRLNWSKHKPAGQEEAADLLDKHDYDKTPSMLPVNPRRASFLGEFGGIGCRVPGHLWTEKAWGYGNTGKDTDRRLVQTKFVTLMDHVATMARSGLCGCVYTQTTDVEGEINGLMTYDRKVFKFDMKALAEVHDRVRKAAATGAAPHERKTLAPVLDKNAKAWAWTAAEPAAGWEKPGFDDSAWARSAGGFGNAEIRKSHPHAKVSTEWNTSSIWLRRKFKYTPLALEKEFLQATLHLFHDEDTEVYLNGRKILSVKGYNNGWAEFPLDIAQFRAALKPGENTLAIKTIQRDGGQYIDAGLSVDYAK